MSAQEVSLTIVALGDSTTAGTPFYRSPVESPPDGAGDVQAPFTYWMTREHPRWKALNRGVNGQRTDEILARLPRDVLEVHPKYVILLAGVNDIYQGVTLEQIQSNLRAMYELAQSHHIRPIAASVLPFTQATTEQSAAIRTLNRWIKTEADRRHIPFCDLHRVVADPANDSALKGSSDGLHPDQAGYRAMGEALALTIERLERPAKHEQ